MAKPTFMNGRAGCVPQNPKFIVTAKSLHLRWRMLQSQIGSEETQTFELARRVRGVLPEVLAVYPHANVEITSSGLTLRESEPRCQAAPSGVSRSSSADRERRATHAGFILALDAANEFSSATCAGTALLWRVQAERRLPAL